MRHWAGVIDFLIARSHPSRVLEIGCAKGFLVLELRERGIEAYGVDISEYALSQAPEEVQPFLSVLDVSEDPLPFEDARFDLVICLESIEHLAQPEHLISEISRVLKPEGNVFVATPSPGTEVARGDVTHINVRSFEAWKRCFRARGICLTRLDPWRWQGDKGRLGWLWKPLRTQIRTILYPILFFLRPARSHLYLLGSKSA